VAYPTSNRCKSTIVNQSGNAKLGEIAVNVDFASFGDNKAELENGQRQLIHVKGALLFLNKDAVSKARIERKFKKISIILVPSESQRSLAMSNGELIIKSTSFDLNKLYSSEDIKDFLLKKL
jgi:hypothetical protein